MIDFLQAAAPAQPQPGFMQQYSFIIMIGLMVLVLWLFMWRPEAKRRKQMQAFRDGLKKGDKVITAGGIYASTRTWSWPTIRTSSANRGRASYEKELQGFAALFFISVTGNGSQPNRCSAATSMSRWLRLPRKSSDRSRSAST